MIANWRILLVDSDPIFRSMVRDMLQRHFPDIPVSEARSRKDAFMQVKRYRPGLILTEIDIQGRRSLDLPQRMRAVHPSSVIAVLTSYDSPEYRDAALKGGAHHFISKSRLNGKTIMALVNAEVIAPLRHKRLPQGVNLDVP
jgi:DNA-binding NarL/FixJ family response regulator